MTNRHEVHNEIRSRTYFENTCYYSVHNLLIIPSVLQTLKSSVRKTIFSAQWQGLGVSSAEGSGCAGTLSVNELLCYWHALTVEERPFS
jgi:uncharacterized protein YkwD